MRVFVTGAAGCTGRVVVRALCQNPHITQVLGMGRSSPTPILQPPLPPRDPFAHPKYTFVIGDIRQDSALEAMRGFDAVVHLAFGIVRKRQSDAEFYDNNVNGTLRVFTAARRVGIKKIINLSSVAIYGSGENLSESSPLRPLSTSAYACHKAEIERRSQTEFPEVIHVRSHYIFGRDALPFLRSMCRSRVFISLPNPVPRIQVVHESDLATAIMHALALPVSGAFNVAAPEIVTIPRLIKNGRRLTFPVPLWVPRLHASMARKRGSQEDFTWLDMIGTELTVNCDRAQAFLGWKPKFTAWQARAEMDPLISRNSMF